MRKFGVRALACGLAALMGIGLAAPAAANAEDVLLIAPAPNSAKVLYITEDMVDSDGEIVISGENWDRVVISKEAAAKDIYFDQVTVGELVVESGSDSNVQLWEVDAKKLTVTEPSLSVLTIDDLRSLLADPATQNTAIDLYFKNAAKNQQALAKTPSIVTMADAKVDEVAARANVNLNLAEGSVGAVALEASDILERVEVTLKGFAGEVSYVGGENVNITTLKMVDSDLSKFTVKESDGNNYLNVEAKNSSAGDVAVEGNAQVAFNAPADSLVVTEKATAAQVAVMNKVGKLSVAADKANVEVAPSGKVSSATVEGDNVTITGNGTLKKVDITGKGAYVSTEGTEVEGDNVYVKPVFKIPMEEITDINLEAVDAGATVTKNADGSSTVVFTPKYQSARFTMPESINKDLISSVIIEANYNAQFCVKFLGTNKADDYPGFGTKTATDGTFTYFISSATQKLAGLDFMGLDDPLKLTIKKITINLLDKVPEAPVVPDPSAPSGLTEDDYVIYNVGDLEVRSGEGGSWGYNDAESVHGGVKYSFSDQYAEVKYLLPEAITLGDFTKFAVTMAQTTGEIALKLYDAEGNQLNVWYGITADDTSNMILDLSGVDSDNNPFVAEKQIAGIGIMAGKCACDVTVFRVAFAQKSNAGGNTPEPIKEFYLVQPTEFDKVAGEDGTVSLGEVYLNWYNDTNNFVNALPAELKADEALAAKFTTMAGIKEVVKAFEFQYVLTQGTAMDGGNPDYEPQSQSVIMGADFDWQTSIYAWQGISGSPKTTTKTILTSSDEFNAITGDTLGKLEAMLVNAKAGTSLQGTYSIKVILY